MPGLEHIVVMQGYEGARAVPADAHLGGAARLGRDNADALKSELAERVADGTARGRRHDRLHLGHDRTAQGRGADPRQPHRPRWSPRRRPPRCRRATSTCSSCRSRTPSRGSSPSSACTGAHHRLRREHRQAPGEPPRDPAPLHLQRAAGVREGLRGRPGAGRGRLAGSSGRSSTGRWPSARRSRGSSRPVGRCRRPSLSSTGWPTSSSSRRCRPPSAAACASPSPAAPRSSREIAEFFHAAGILILEGYGLTETCPVLTFNREDALQVRLGRAGACRESSSRSPRTGRSSGAGGNIAKGYFKKPEATARGLPEPTAGSPPATSARFDDDGFLFITDRKKDLIVTAGGMNIAPQNIENLLKGDPFISQVMVHGDRRPYPVALITLNPEELAKFAREQGILTPTRPRSPSIPRSSSASRARRGEELRAAVVRQDQEVRHPARRLHGGERRSSRPTLKVKRKVITEQHRPGSTPSTARPALDRVSASTARSPSSPERAAGWAAPWPWRSPRRGPTSRWPRGPTAELEETARSHRDARATRPRRAHRRDGLRAGGGAGGAHGDRAGPARHRREQLGRSPRSRRWPRCRPRSFAAPSRSTSSGCSTAAAPPRPG